MCFGKGLSQQKAEDCMYPHPNNFCGGFALNAVLAELRTGTGFNNPMEVYCKIQEYQTYNVAGNGYRFLHDTRFIVNGTLMSLPSGICAAFNSYPTGKKVVVYYTTEFGSSPMFGALIGEESGRITALGIHVEVFDGALPTIDQSYVLVLVNDCHWIAVKRIEEGKNFICYDPATGNAETGDSMITAMQKSGYGPGSINGLYICIP